MSTLEAAKMYRDGNYQDVPADETVELEPGQEPWAIDSEGNELRKGDHVLVVSTRDDFGSEWRGHVALVTGVPHGNLYHASGDGIGPRIVGLHHVTSTRALSVERVTYPARSSWAIPGMYLRKIDLTSEEGKRVMLADALGRRAKIDEQAARVENDRVVVSLEIRRLREDLGDAES